MTENDLSIDTSAFKKRRPLPPGQTRHVYPGAEDKPYIADIEDEEPADLPEPQPEPEQPKRKENRPSRKRAKSQPRDENDDTPALVRFLMDRRVRTWLGLASLITGCAILVVLLSYIKDGALDQAYVLNLSPEEILAAGIKVKSNVGAAGAWLGHVLFAEAFGVGAFVVASYFFILGVKLVTGRRFSFWGLTFRCALLAIATSIVVGLITYAVGSETFWGGVHGHYVNKWLLDMTGIPGAVLVSILLIGTLAVVYLNELSRLWRTWKERAELRRKEMHERQEAALAKRQEEEAAAAVPTPETRETEAKTFPVEDTETEVETEPENPFAAETETEESDRTDTPAEAFVIDEPTRESQAGKDTSAEKTQTEKTESEPAAPGFEIDVPVTEMGKGSGSVAQRLVAQQGEYDPRKELSRFKFPTLDMLENRPIKTTADSQEQEANKERIIKTLGNYSITVDSIKATVGPTVTLYEIVPTEGIRIAQIKRLEDDIALSLAAKGIRIIAPMPGKGTVGIEVPNSDPQIVPMRGILASKKFRESKAKLPIAMGATISNEVFVTDLAAMPHALVAGATGQGKSVGLNVIISSLLYSKHPSELKFVLIDPKMVEFSVYERLRGHYLASLPDEEEAIVTDPSKVLNVLNSLCVEMDNRYALLRKAAVVKIEDYNQKFCQRRLNPEKGHKYLPYIVVIIDEFADLIMTGGRDIEMPVMRITQKARAVGIHMIIATQRPSTNVLTGLIKANCPSRIAFRVLQNVDSRTILDRPGAEQLIGRGDMLYSQGGDLERMQCAYITSEEIETICDSIDAQTGFDSPYPLPEPLPQNGSAIGGGGSLPAGGMDRDPLFDEAARFVVTSATASTSSLQRRFEIGYNRAGKIMDQMEAAGLVGPASGSKPRAVLIDPAGLENILANR